VIIYYDLLYLSSVYETKPLKVPYLISRFDIFYGNSVLMKPFSPSDNGRLLHIDLNSYLSQFKYTGHHLLMQIVKMQRLPFMITPPCFMLVFVN